MFGRYQIQIREVTLPERTRKVRKEILIADHQVLHSQEESFQSHQPNEHHDGELDPPNSPQPVPDQIMMLQQMHQAQKHVEKAGEDSEQAPITIEDSEAITSANNSATKLLDSANEFNEQKSIEQFQFAASETKDLFEHDEIAEEHKKAHVKLQMSVAPFMSQDYQTCMMAQAQNDEVMLQGDQMPVNDPPVMDTEEEERLKDYDGGVDLVEVKKDADSDQPPVIELLAKPAQPAPEASESNVQELSKQRKRDKKGGEKATKTVVVIEERISSRNLEVTVKDTETLNEFQATVAFEQVFIPKLVKWIEKGKYVIKEQASEEHLLLQVDIFSFDLLVKDDRGGDPASMLKELRKVRKERETIMRDLKLFNYFFFNVHSERLTHQSSTHMTKIPPSQLEKHIENPQTLFVAKQAQAINLGGQHVLAFTEDMCFDETPQKYPGPYLDKLFIYGPGFEYEVCPLSSRTPIPEAAASVFISEQEQLDAAGKSEKAGVCPRFGFKYQVGLALRENQIYTVYLPKALG